MPKKAEQKLVIVTGLSGAGMSSVLKVMEDFGYEVIDNCPLSLIDPLLAETNSKTQRIALGIDCRTRGFSPEAVLETARRVNADIMFITCEKRELQKRFSATRRRHPMAKGTSVLDGIKQERELLKPIAEEAKVTIDTTELSVHDLRHMLEGYFTTNKKNKLTISLLSFGFKHGAPRGADIVMDVRFLRNPHWDKKLKPLTGKSKAIGDYIKKDKAFKPFLKNFKTLLEPLLPKYMEEGKNYLTIAIGCTGGRHRSVYTVEMLKPWLEKQGASIHLVHRDIEK